MNYLALPPELIGLAAAFVFVFALVFGLLTYANIFAKKDEKSDRRINGAIALAVAFFSIMYKPLVDALTNIMPLAVLILTPIFFLILLKKIFDHNADPQHGADYFPLIVTIGLLMLVLITQAPKLTPFLPSGFDPSNVLWAIGIAGALMFFFLVYKQK